MGETDGRDRRFVFGEVAELYDLARPRYPSAILDDLVAFEGVDAGASVLEVGAGTGQATRDLAARGLDVTAIEPNEAMFAVAARNCGQAEGISLVRATFEEFSAEPASFDLITAAQSWHWIAPDVGYAKAASLLREGGWLAVFWNLPVDRGPAAGEIDEVYARYSPERGTISRWGGQDSSGSTDVAELGEQLASAGAFGDLVERTYPWHATYATEEYLALVRTHSDYRLLDEPTRALFLDGLGEVIDRHGGSITIGFATQLYAAQRTS